jgi:hypothetical protein
MLEDRLKDVQAREIKITCHCSRQIQTTVIERKF